MKALVFYLSSVSLLKFLTILYLSPFTLHFTLSPTNSVVYFSGIYFSRACQIKVSVTCFLRQKITLSQKLIPEVNSEVSCPCNTVQKSPFLLPPPPIHRKTIIKMVLFCNQTFDGCLSQILVCKEK